MANIEACEVWIEQRIEEELPTGKSYRAIGREIAAEILKRFEARVKPSAIERRAERTAKRSATFVAPPSTPPNHEESEKIQEYETCSECGTIYKVTPCNYGPDGCPKCFPPIRHGGPRDGAGRKSKYSRPQIVQPKTPTEDICTEEFKKAFDVFFVAIKNAKRLGWKEVSREAALKYLAVLYDVTTIN